MARPLRTLLFMVAPALLAAKCGKTVGDEVTPLDRGINSPDVALQVASIDPNFGTAGTSFSAEVFGNGFDNGADVTIGGAPADARYRDSSTLAVTVPALSVGSYDVVVENVDGARATLRRGLTLVAGDTATRCRAVTVRFGFDSSVLDAAIRGRIETVATCLRGSTDFVRVEGHCDDRGTTEYNLALGQRRADAVARYLVGLGVAPSRLQAVSYGEERPASATAGDEGRAENRRADIVPGGGR
ncbi:MAG: hypothetical protein EXR71_06060 [Myxococcales bacterium]|nr:hypothetical protein [Myxococcales bacterium]